jgi:predicted transcriptional regulator
MIVIAEMQNGGVFEAASKKKLTEQMIQHFAERDKEAGQIKAIFGVFKDDSAEEFCKEAVQKIQEIVNAGVAESRKIADQEYRGQREIESDFRAGLL